MTTGKIIIIWNANMNINPHKQNVLYLKCMLVTICAKYEINVTEHQR